MSNAMISSPRSWHDHVLDVDFWCAEFPHLSINSLLGANQKPESPYSELTIGAVTDQVKREGYFQCHDPQLAARAHVLGSAVQRMVALGIPPAFLMLFDEPWQCFYHQHVLLKGLLDEYLILPDFWVWHLDPAAQESGWRPHRDKGRLGLAADGSPLAMTLWIPLSEATPLNGCMYVLPADRDPAYNTPEESNVPQNVSAIRALPAVPGDVLGWNQAVLHWGSQSVPRAHGPRISMALEFQRSDAAPFNKPLLPPFCNLEFPVRLALIAKQVLQYQHMYRLTPELETTIWRIVNQ